MPFKVRYKIYEPGKIGPCIDTENRSYAYLEWTGRCQKQPLTRLVPDVTPVNLTNSERYVWLVYRVLKAIRKFFDERGHVTKEQSKENWDNSMALERELDLWNSRTRFYLQGHPKSTPDDPKAFAFFEVVEVWRQEWHKYFAYKKQKDKRADVEREMKKKCEQFEKEIKKYVKLVIGI